MYTRSYYQDNSCGVPEDYDGNAFRSGDIPTVVTPTYGETKVSPEYMAEDVREDISEAEEECKPHKKEESEGVFSRILSRIPLKKLPFGLGERLWSTVGIKAEDIIIIAVALLLIFSGEGDKLLGIALLALLFV